VRFKRIKNGDPGKYAEGAELSMLGRLRANLSVVLLVDSAVALGLVGLTFQRSVVRALIIFAALTIPMAAFAAAFPSSVRLLRVDMRARRQTVISTAAVLIASSAMFTSVLGLARSVGSSVSTSQAQELGAIDLVVNASTARSIEQVRSALEDLSGRAEVSGLFDAPPLVIRSIRGGIETDRSPAPARVLEVSTVEAAGFGGSPTSSGLEGISLQRGEAVLSFEAANRLGGNIGQVVRVHMVGGGDLELRVKGLASKIGLLSLPDVDGRATTNVIVGVGTLSGVADTQTQHSLALSLCGRPSKVMFENGVRVACDSDPVDSAVFSRRADDEVGRLLANMTAISTGANEGAIFGEPTEPSDSPVFSIQPVKQRSLDIASAQYAFDRRTVDLAAFPLAIVALIGCCVAAIIGRSKRQGIERMVGVSTVHSVGNQSLFVAAVAFPAVVAGTLLGIGIVQLALVVLRLRSLSSAISPSPTSLLLDGAIACFGSALIAGVVSSWCENRIDPAVLLSSRLRGRSVAWWRPIGFVLVLVGAAFALLAREGALLVAGVGCLIAGVTALLAASLGSSKYDGVSTWNLLAGGGACMLVLSIVATSSVIRGSDLRDQRSPLIVLGVALVVMTIAWVLIVRGGDVGRRVAGIGISTSEGPFLKVVRTGSARRAGAWAFAGPVALTFALSSAGFSSSTMASLASKVSTPATAKLVEVDDVYPVGDQQEGVPIADDGSGRLILTRTALISGGLVPTGLVTDRLQGASSIRQFWITQLPAAQTSRILAQTRATGVQLLEGQVLAGREDFVLAFGKDPVVGDEVRIPIDNTSVTLQIAGLIEGQTRGALWVPESTWNQIPTGVWFGRRLVVPMKGTSASETRADLRIGLRGRPVTIANEASLNSSQWNDARSLSQAIRWIGLCMGIAALSGLLLRWAIPRRRELKSFRVAALSDAVATRSISHDLVGHIVPSGMAGLVAGIALSMVARRFASPSTTDLFVNGLGVSGGRAIDGMGWSIPPLYVLAVAGFPFPVAFLMARLAHLGSGAKRAVLVINQGVSPVASSVTPSEDANLGGDLSSGVAPTVADVAGQVVSLSARRLRRQQRPSPREAGQSSLPSEAVGRPLRPQFVPVPQTPLPPVQ
jgi:hypothetical protein